MRTLALAALLTMLPLTASAKLPVPDPDQPPLTNPTIPGQQPVYVPVGGPINWVPSEVYTIDKGAHYANGTKLDAIFNHWKGTEMSAWFQFDASAQYTTKAPSNQADINKLWGFTDCNDWDPQNGSARFGWNWMNDKIQIYAFVDDGQHHYKQIGTTTPGEVSFGTIRLEGTDYAFYYKGTRTTIHRQCGDSKMKGYYLYPYFGGDETAPHQMKIRLNRYTL